MTYRCLWLVPLLIMACKSKSFNDDASVDAVTTQYSACSGTMAERASTATSVRAMLQPRAGKGAEIPSQAFRNRTFSRPVAKMFPMGHRFYNGDSPITGYPHEGYDYSGTDALLAQGHSIEGKPIHAIAEGRVAFVMTFCKPYGQGNNYCGDGWGNHVIIDHGGNVYSRYAHMGSVSARVNQVVQAGTVLGKVGMTGWAPGPHLHIEIGTLNKGQVIERCKPTFFGMVWDPAPYLMGDVDDREPLSADSSDPSPSDAQLRTQAVGKRCEVSAGGDSYSNARDAAGREHPVVGTVARGARVKIRGWVNDGEDAPWASIEATSREGETIGAQVGKPAFVKHNQLNLNDCTN